MTTKQTTLQDIICGLVNIYGPIHIDELMAKIGDYFYEESKDYAPEDILMVVNTLKDNLIYFGEDGIVSFCNPEYLKEVYESEEVKYFDSLGLEKSFPNKQQILNFANMYDLKNNPTFDHFVEYMKSLNFMDDNAVQDLIDEAIAAAFYMFDEDKLYEDIQKRCLDKIDRNKFIDKYMTFYNYLPRGFLHGYSIIELSDITAKDVDIFEQKISLPTNSFKTKKYSYQECLDLAGRLKDTDMFIYFCSDNIIELAIDNKPFYLQLLGYYNGDRNIVIYGSEENLIYNYQFMLTEDSYPDIATRVNYCEISLDNYEGFLTPKLEAQLKAKDYGRDPLIFNLDPIEGPKIINQQQIDEIGTALESLLLIENKKEEYMYMYSEEGYTNRIVQLYLKEDETVDMGFYHKHDLGLLYFPFRLEKLPPIDIKANDEKTIYLGVYAMKIMSEEKPPFITIVYDKEDDQIINIVTTLNEQTGFAASEVVDVLESNNIRPADLRFNNGFAYKLLEDLVYLYDIDDTYSLIDNEKLDEIYTMLVNDDFDSEDNGDVVIH